LRIVVLLAQIEVKDIFYWQKDGKTPPSFDVIQLSQQLEARAASWIFVGNLPQESMRRQEFQRGNFLLGPQASRPQRAARRAVFGIGLQTFSRFALIAGETPAVPVNALTACPIRTETAGIARKPLQNGFT